MDIAYQKHIAGFEQSNFMDINKQKVIGELIVKFVADYSKDSINNLKIDEYINVDNPMISYDIINIHNNGLRLLLTIITLILI